MRYEPDTKKLFITAKTFKDDCVDLQINYKDTLKQLEKNGVLLKIDNKRLAKGSSLMSAAVRCLIFDASHPDFFDMDVLIPTSDEDAGGES